jgi:hypothetical protein
MRLAIPGSFRPLRLLLIVALVEIFLGGGGRLIDTGALTIRMYFFIVALFFGVVIMFGRGHMHQSLVRLTLAFTVLLVVGIVMGTITGQSLNYILIDVKPLLFFYYIFFFAALVKTEEDVNLVIRLLKICSVVLAVGYLIMLVLINAKRIPFMPFYVWASGTEEISFRGEFAFFYKGFVYLCIGIFFFNWREGWKSKLAIITIIVAVMLTFTRGFVLSLFILYLIKLTLIDKRWLSFFFICVLSLFFAAAVWTFVLNEENLKASREMSDQTRVQQIEDLKDELNPVTFIVGRGFGIVRTPSRETQHLEISYAEVLLKQGMLGIAFWVYLAYLIYRYYNLAARNNNGKRAKPFILASIFVYIQSFVNPYILNPMGMTALMLSLISLYILSRPNTDLPEVSSSVPA